MKMNDSQTMYTYQPMYDISLSSPRRGFCPSTHVWTTAGWFTTEEINVLRSYQNLPPEKPECDDVSRLRIRAPPPEEEDEDPAPVYVSPPSYYPAPSAPPATPYDDYEAEAALEYQDYLEQCAYD